MKKNTLLTLARSSGSQHSKWGLLAAIAQQHGDDNTAANNAVLEFVVTLGFRNAVHAWSDKCDDIDKEIRTFLSNLNEEYPFDVVSANHQVKRLFSSYVEFTLGFNSYSQARAAIQILQTFDKNDETNTPEAIRNAWDSI